MPNQFDNKTFESQALADFLKVVKTGTDREISEACITLEEAIGRYESKPLVSMAKSSEGRVDLIEWIEAELEEEEELMPVIATGKDFNRLKNETFKLVSVTVVGFKTKVKDGRPHLIKEYTSINLGRDHLDKEGNPLVGFTDNPSVQSHMPAFTSDIFSVTITDRAALQRIDQFGCFFSVKEEKLWIPVNSRVFANYEDAEERRTKESFTEEDEISFLPSSDSSIKVGTIRACSSSYESKNLLNSEFYRTVEKTLYTEEGVEMVKFDGVKAMKLDDAVKRFGTTSTAGTNLFKITKALVLVDENGMLADFLEKDQTGAKPGEPHIYRDGDAPVNARAVVGPINTYTNETRGKMGLCKVQILESALLECGLQGRPFWSKAKFTVASIEAFANYEELAKVQGLSFRKIGNFDNFEDAEIIITKSISKIGIPKDLGYFYLMSTTKDSFKNNWSRQTTSKIVEREHMMKLGNILLKKAKENIMMSLLDTNIQKPLEYILNMDAINLVNDKGFAPGEEKAANQLAIDNCATAKNKAVWRRNNKAKNDLILGLVNNHNVALVGGTQTLQPEPEVVNKDGEVVSLELPSDLSFCGNYSDKLDCFDDKYNFEKRLDELQYEIDAIMEIPHLDSKGQARLAKLQKMFNKTCNKLTKATERCEEMIENHVIVREVIDLVPYFRLVDFTIKYPSQDTDEFECTQYMSKRELEARCKDKGMPWWVYRDMVEGCKSYVYMPCLEIHRLMLAGYDFDKDQKSSIIDKDIVKLMLEVKNSRQLMIIDIEYLKIKK